MQTSIPIPKIDKLREGGLDYRADLSTDEYHCFNTLSNNQATGVNIYIKDGLNIDDINFEVIDRDIGVVGYRDGSQKLNLYVDGAPAEVKIDVKMLASLDMRRYLILVYLIRHSKAKVRASLKLILSFLTLSAALKKSNYGDRLHKN